MHKKLSKKEAEHMTALKKRFSEAVIRATAFNANVEKVNDGNKTCKSCAKGTTII